MSTVIDARAAFEERRRWAGWVRWKIANWKAMKERDEAIRAARAAARAARRVAEQCSDD
jgi:hypothetical protein